jgi:hypothetical protein
LFTEQGEDVKMAMKVRVEVTNEEGVKTSWEREADLSSEMLKLLLIRNITKFLEDQLSSSSAMNPYECEGEELTIKQRLTSFLRYDERAPKDWFTSSQVKRIYEDVYEENVRLSTISTYLASLHSEGVLLRKGSRAMRQYRMVPTESAKAVRAFA